MKDVVIRKIDEAINIVKQDSSYLTTGDQQVLESKLQAIKDMIAETYDVRMSALPCRG